MKYLGIDYGSKRTGIAVSDERGAYAFPKKVFVTSGKLAAQVKECVIEYGVQAIVLGESRDYKGLPNKVMKDVLSFKKELEGLTRLPVYLEPEFMTSMQAERLDGELGGKKDMLDATAAAFILQSFLDKLEKLGTPDTSDKNVSNV
jgi:putative Holliday junction resolvase